ncbi:MAG TPA: dihydrolipoamide acetyltransferase family protein [Rhizomicrobium sp.]|jgi:2-oxoisovalerate dehydrogenase E2 component (dihydrolipoyl transacylase)
MGRYVFKLPDVGEGTAEAEIVAWHVKVGERIDEDQNLVDVMTDKATVEMTSPVTGVVVSLHGTPGEMATVGAPLVELEVEGAGNVGAATAAKSEKRPPVPEKRPSTASKPSAERATNKTDLKEHAPASPSAGEGWAEEAARPSQTPAFATRAPGVKPLASPAVRRRAEELGVHLQFVPGSGPVGRIEHTDLDNYIASGGRATVVRGGLYAQREGVEEIRVIGLRRKIAEKMQQAKRRIPHFAYVEEIDMTALEDLRAHLNATRRPDQPKLTLLPFVMRGLVRLLPAYPQINARFDDEAGIVHRHAAVHVGIATQTANGLIVPVVRHAEALDIWQAAAEVGRLAALTRDGKASRDELSGSTITITSLGALGGIVTTPVINHPEVAIIGPNAILQRPVVRDGQIVVRRMMNLSSSFDHRVVDGYDAAEFIQKLKGVLEHPATLFMN